MSKSVSFGGVIAYPNSNSLKEEKSLKNRFNCGVLRSSLKMVGSINGSLISVRLVSSKLRKREDSAVTNNNSANINNNNNQPPVEREVRPLQTQQQQPVDPPPFLWRYSNGSSQLGLYNNDQLQTSIVLPAEETGECKGFRKNLRGKWRRLVKKKPPQEVYTIPAEFREQLKQIYVYWDWFSLIPYQINISNVGILSTMSMVPLHSNYKYLIRSILSF